MGVTCWCPLGNNEDLETGIVAEKMLNLSPMSHKRKELETSSAVTALSMSKGRNILARSISSNVDGAAIESPQSLRYELLPRSSSLMIPGSSEHEAAVKLQKVYKSFRTRRKLADCAVLVEQSWWKLLDFAELKRSSISFFDVEKQETAISRWSRARTKAAKVGKGLSKNNKAQKLALQHWLEAIDPRHRYGHNLHFYYVKWLHSQSREPFFYWLDVGEGKDVNLVEKCSRSKLQQQSIKYLGPLERKAYEIELTNGQFFKKQTGELLDTTDGPKGAKYIFVLSTSRILYVGRKQKGTFQHSSFLAGGATLAAGQLIAESGNLRAIWPHSGHYRPTEENFKDFISFLRENNVDLTNVQLAPVDEEQRSYHRENSKVGLRSNSSEEDLTQKENVSKLEETNAGGLRAKNVDVVSEEASALHLDHPMPRGKNSLGRKLTYLEIPTRDDFLQILQNEDQNPASSVRTADGYDSGDEELFFSEENATATSNQNDEEELHIEVMEEQIIRRVNSWQDSKSYQFGKQLSCTWTSGAGPRISCVRDYPTELQNHALEEVHLSPITAPSSRSHTLYTPRYKAMMKPKATTPLSHAISIPPNNRFFSKRFSPRSNAHSSPLSKANSIEIISIF